MKKEEKTEKEATKSEVVKDAQESKVEPIDPQEVEQLRAQIKELEDLREQFVRKAADFENAKRRLSKEKEEYLKFGQSNLLEKLLPVLDNFERALSHAGEESVNLKGIVDGIQMVFKQLQSILIGEGLKRVETKNQTFDPHQHEAIAYVEEDGEENAILDEVEPGYFLHDRLLRAAKVRVRIAPKSDSSSESERGKA